MKRFELKAFIEGLNQNEFVKQCKIPLGYRASFPIIQTKGDKLFLVIPFNKVKKSPASGVSMVYPIAYTVTFELFAVKTIPEQFKSIPGAGVGYSNCKPIGFETLKYTEAFASVPMGKPIEEFPHRELKEIGKEEYQEKMEKFYTAYDAIINDALGLEKAAGIEKLEFKRILNLFVGPRTRELYRLIDNDFFEAFFME